MLANDFSSYKNEAWKPVWQHTICTETERPRYAMVRGCTLILYPHNLAHNRNNDSIASTQISCYAK
jgi:hypothetical protein